MPRYYPDEYDVKESKKKIIFVETPKYDLYALQLCSTFDLIATVLIVFSIVEWDFNKFWDEQGRNYSFYSSGFDLLVLCATKWVVLFLCLFKNFSGRIVVKNKDKIIGSGFLAASFLFSFASLMFGAVKLCVGASDSSEGAWVPAIACIIFTCIEMTILKKIRNDIRLKAMEEISQSLLDEQDFMENGSVEIKKKYLTAWQLFHVLKPYFWPRGDDERAVLNRTRSTATWLFVIASKVCSVTSPFFLSDATNALYEGDYKGAAKGVTYYALLSLASKILKEFQSLIYLKVKQQAYIEIAEQVFIHLHELSLQWHLQKKMGNVMRSMDRGTDAANNLVSYLFLYLVPAIGECIATVIIFYIKFDDWKLAVLAFVSLSMYGYATVKITMWRKKLRGLTNKFDNEFHDKATDSIINFETVKYFSNESYEAERFTKSVRQYQHHSTSTQASLSFLNIVQQIIMNVTLLGGLILAAKSVTAGNYSVGEFVSVNTYMVNLFIPLNFLGTVYNIIIQAFVDIRNLSELLAESPDIVDMPGAKPIKLPPKEIGVEVEFRNVHFHYPSQAPTSGIQGISFVVPAGKTTAIVGHTGAGKTTISRLLFRFYDPIQGEVLIHGTDIKEAQQKSVRNTIGVVPQDTVMFNETILHNIRYGKLDATMEEIEAAAEAAQILPFIESLTDKWETTVGERGLKLSGGEKQRVAIARCLLKNPPIVLLDEATSALDTRTEHGVQEALQRLKKNRTTITIAHRLSTIRSADQIIVLSKGKIVERGTHKELLELEGEYAHMWNMQIYERKRMISGGEINEDEEEAKEEEVMNGINGKTEPN